jgi:hypothetical protein
MAPSRPQKQMKATILISMKQKATGIPVSMMTKKPPKKRINMNSQGISL